VLVALGLVVAGSAGAATISSWVGGKAAVPQVVTATSPNCPGTMIMITGSGFVSDGGVVSVSVGNVPSNEFIVGSDQFLYARVGPGATDGPVTVTTRAGSVTATAKAIVWPCQATGVAATKPAIDSVAPQKAKAGKKLTLNGSGFVGATSVTVAGEKAAYAVPTDNLMYVKVPADAKDGLLTILVTNAKGSAKVVFQKAG